MSQVTITVSPLPESFCPTSFRDGFIEAAQFLRADLSGTLNTFNFGPVTPTPENRDKPWLRTESTGAPDRFYVFYNGYWIAKHMMAPGSVIIYTGTEASITTFDSGEAGAVTDISGPFWEKLSALDAKFPIGKGTLASGTALAVGDTGGEEKHTLSLLEMPRHRHNLDTRQKSTNNPNQATSLPIIDNDYNVGSILISTRAEGGDEALTSDNHNQAHNTLPPYSVVLFIKRTARLYHRL